MFTFDQLKYPLIQAPMAGGPNTPEMVSTVVNCGGVGSFGFAYNNVDKITQDIKTAQALIEPGVCGALNINFFVFSPVDAPAAETIEQATQALNNVAGEDLEIVPPGEPFFPDLNSQLEAVWSLKPDIVTFHFGIPEPAVIDRAHNLGIAVGITATCAEEARQIEAAGADFIVAQGIEAGGHRGIFDPKNPDEALSCFALISQLKQVIQLPLAAAGGIMSRKHIDTAIELGARVVQMGSAFLTTEESGASSAHKDYLLNHGEREAVITLGFSGRPARGIENRFIQQMTDEAVLPFPLQNTLTGKLRATASANSDGEMQSLWAGSNFRECRSESINDLIGRLFP